MNNQEAQKSMTVEEVANEVISRLGDQEIDRIRHHPSSSSMHFGLGLWIRNEYIHSRKMEFPPAEFKDDDEIGALLADTKIHGAHLALFGMSRRIKEKYMTEDELDRWGGGDDEEEG